MLLCLVKCRIKRVDRSGGAGFAAHQREAALLLRLNRPAFEPKGLALFQFVSRWAVEMTDPHVSQHHLLVFRTRRDTGPLDWHPAPAKIRNQAGCWLDPIAKLRTAFESDTRHRQHPLL